MNPLQAVIMGIVEGVTEFLPVSSTAHLEITQQFLRIPATDFVKSFIIAVQLGAIISVVLLYRRKIFLSFYYVRNIIIAFLPTGIVGFLLYSLIKSFLLGNIFVALVMMFLGGVVILFFERHYKGKEQDEIKDLTIETLSIRQLLILGCAQALAAVPGVSRSGAVIISGRMLRLPRTLITEFSFLLAVPTMLAATSYDLLKSGFHFSSDDWISLSIGFVVAFITAILTVRFFINFIKKNSFEIFGWYRILASLFLLFYFYIFL